MGWIYIKPKIEILKDDSLISHDQQSKILDKIQDWFTSTYIKKIDLTDQLGQFNNTPEERSFIFKLNENFFNFYELNILDEFKLIEESKRKEIHALKFRLGKNVIFNSEVKSNLRPKFSIQKKHFDKKNKILHWICPFIINI